MFFATVVVVVLAVVHGAPEAPVAPVWSMLGNSPQHLGQSTLQGPSGSSVR